MRRGYSIPHPAIEKQREHGRSQRQLVLDFLGSYHAEHGWMPSVQEVADAIGVGISTAHAHLSKLVAEGAITRGPGARMIRVTNGRIKLRE